jgi:hypothetical protein
MSHGGAGTRRTAEHARGGDPRNNQCKSRQCKSWRHYPVLRYRHGLDAARPFFAVASSAAKWLGYAPTAEQQRKSAMRKTLLVAALGLTLATMPPALARAPAPLSAAFAPETAATAAPDQTKLFSVLGMEVKSASGTDIGRIVDVLADESGRPRAAIIDFGGFLGVGTRKIAVDWRALRFGRMAKGKDRAILPDLTIDQLKKAPQYDPPAHPVAVVTSPAAVERGTIDP